MNESQIISKVLKESEAMVKRNENMVNSVEKALKESCNRSLTSLDRVKLATVIDNVSNLLMMNEAKQNPWPV